MSRPPLSAAGTQNLQTFLNEAFSAYRAGQLDAAAALCRKVIALNKREFAPRHLLGIVEAQRGNLEEGVRQITKAIKIDSSSSDAFVNLARMQFDLDRLADSEQNLKRAIQLDPKNILAHTNMAALQARQKKFGAALESAERALSLAPNDLAGLFNRANALFDLHRSAESLATFQHLLSLNSSDPDTWIGVGNAHAQLGQLAEALNAYEQAGIRAPNHPRLWYCRGNVFMRLSRHQDAVDAYNQELSQYPEFAPAWRGLGATLNFLKRYEEAIVAYEKSRQLDPAMTDAISACLWLRMMICDWTRIERDRKALKASVETPEFSAEPLALMSFPVSPQQHLGFARRLSVKQFAGIGINPPPLAPDEQGRIRIAYVSSDFGDHPVSRLLVGVLENHDRSKFDITAFSLGPRIDTPLGERIVKSCDHFVDAALLDDEETTKAARDLGIHIAVDLNGYTAGNRMPIFARRAAPIQVGYLGYAGTTGNAFMDYLISDRTVIGPDDEQFYSEKVVCLPDSFMPADSRREISAQTMTRREAGLPEHGFVFCDFNEAYKVTPELFDVWMSLLRQTDGSVLWLRSYNPTAVENLKQEAVKRGVAAERLVFAPPVPLIADHLARHRLADLFLDTLPYNAHATASDALWAGLPIVTCLGNTFAGRVAASQIKAAGLPELLTTSLGEYEALALKLAHEPALLAAITGKLAAGRLTCALFDTVRYTRHLEAAYTAMWERARNGEQPVPFEVRAIS